MEKLETHDKEHAYIPILNKENNFYIVDVVFDEDNETISKILDRTGKGTSISAEFDEYGYCFIVGEEIDLYYDFDTDFYRNINSAINFINIKEFALKLFNDHLKESIKNDLEQKLCSNKNLYYEELYDHLWRFGQYKEIFIQWFISLCRRKQTDVLVNNISQLLENNGEKDKIIKEIKALN